MTDHEAGCEGFHSLDMACGEAIALRGAWNSDPWHCHGVTRSGYHAFTDDGPDGVCLNDGCERRQRELWTELGD